MVIVFVVVLAAGMGMVVRLLSPGRRARDVANAVQHVTERAGAMATAVQQAAEMAGAAAGDALKPAEVRVKPSPHSAA